MGRELRRVASDWNHPTENGDYIPLLNRPKYDAEDPESDYMPDWPESVKTHFQMYETTTEGTPISPVFPTMEEVARYCADHGVSAFGPRKASYEQWLATCRVGGCLSAVVGPKGFRSGVEHTGDESHGQ